MTDELDLGLEEGMALEEETAQEGTPIEGATCTAYENGPLKGQRMWPMEGQAKWPMEGQVKKSQRKQGF